MTPERITRLNDERLYQPKIHSRRIRELYRISQKTGEAITVLVDRALQEFIERRSSRDDQDEVDEEEEEVPSAGTEEQ